MAGTFTHWMIVEEVLYRFNKLPAKHKYFPMIKGNNHFVTLGAVGPDYPYLNEIAKGLFKHHSWADRMHYEKTGEFVKVGIDNLLDLSGADFEVCLSWLCGYVTHLIADATIHPIVNAIVGPYGFNATEHRHCEMIQDSFIFHYITKTELKYSAPDDDGFVGLINMCSDPKNEKHMSPVVKDYWIKTLKITHPGGSNNFDSIDPDDWHKSFISRINTAADPMPFFRHLGVKNIGEEESLAYKKTKDITSEEYKKFIGEIKLPSGGTGNFKNDAFDKAVNNVLEVWEKLFLDIEKQDSASCLAYIKNWNLDTGVDEDQIFFWS